MFRDGPLPAIWLVIRKAGGLPASKHLTSLQNQRGPNSSPVRITRQMRLPLSRNACRLGRLRWFIVKNTIAVIAGDYFIAAAYIRHYLRPQRHEARSAGTIAGLCHGDAITNACADAIELRAHRLGQLFHHAFAFGSRLFQLLLLHFDLLVELLEPLFHLRAPPLDFRSAFA